MAVRKYLLKHYNETTKEDSSIHLQTSSDIVLRPDGSSVEDALSSVKSNMDKLTSDSGDGSIKQAVADGISSIVAGAPESLDTLREMSDWIQTHENDASAMNSRITKNTNDIAALSEDVADTAATVNANNVKITNLQSTVTNNTTTINTLSNDLDNKFDKTDIIPVENGGTGVSSIDELTAIISGSPTIVLKPDTSALTAGQTITWNDKEWIVVDVAKNTVTLCSTQYLNVTLGIKISAIDRRVMTYLENLDNICDTHAVEDNIYGSRYIVPNIRGVRSYFIPTSTEFYSKFYIILNNFADLNRNILFWLYDLSGPKSASTATTGDMTHAPIAHIFTNNACTTMAPLYGDTISGIYLCAKIYK